MPLRLLKVALLPVAAAVAVAACSSCPSAKPKVDAPESLVRVQVFPTSGPLYEGNAFALSRCILVTCKHVVPEDAQHYEVGGERIEAPPISSGRDDLIGGDWSLLAPGDVSVEQPIDVTVNTLEPVAAGTPAWVVGWQADSGGWTVEEARVGEIRPGSARSYYLNCMRELDNPGLSGAPVVIEKDGALVVIGMYVGYVDRRSTIFGLVFGRKKRNVFIRPRDWMQHVTLNDGR